MFNSALSQEREVRGLIFLKFYFKFIAVPQIQFCDSFVFDKQSKQFHGIPGFDSHFKVTVYLQGCVVCKRCSAPLCPVDIKIYRVCSIHVFFKCFEPRLYLVCHFTTIEKRLKTRTGEIYERNLLSTLVTEDFCAARFYLGAVGENWERQGRER